ncbi:hypothetical protein EDB89DRAFT_1912738 [Lactarius sanguifluus]|nr:hypothetical protein EDB89DRAFT_1912738 [Lactarius sanguifluus]
MSYSLTTMSFLGDKAFRKHFIDPGLGDGSGSETHRVTAIEALHYADTIVNHHLSDQNAYRARAEPHIYSLLRRFATNHTSPHRMMAQFDVPWSLHLVTTRETDQTLYQYTPRSNFFMSIKGFPHLLREISSDKLKQRDQRRMLLQAACLVRLGNKLITENSPLEPPTFFLKAIYIDHDYNAAEYTLYQRGLVPGDDSVYISVYYYLR